MKAALLIGIGALALVGCTSVAAAPPAPRRRQLGAETPSAFTRDVA